MRNMVKKFFVSLLSVMLGAMSLVGCDKEDSGDWQVKAEELNHSQTKVVKAEKQLNLVCDPVTDGEKNYFYFKIGETDNVPVYYEHAYWHNKGKTDSVYEWETKTITQNAYVEANKQCSTISTSKSEKVSIETGTGASIGLNYKGLQLGLSAKVSEAFEMSIGSTSSVSVSQTFTKSLTDITEKSKKRTVTIHKDSPSGFYRYTVYASFDVYAVLVCNIATLSIEYDYFSIPQADSYFDEFRYSEDEYRFDTSISEKLVINMDEVVALGLNFFTRDIENRLPGSIYGRATYQTSNRIKIDDTGKFGLTQMYTDTIDLNHLVAYMNDGYVFRFHIIIHSESDTIAGIPIDGYKQMYLYNRYNQKVSESASNQLNEELACRNYGLVRSLQWEQDKGTDTFDLELRGSECVNVMFFRYDAQGKGSDTWYRNTLDVMIEVVKV